MFNVYCWYVAVTAVIEPRVVQVVPSGDVCIFNVQAVVFVLRLYQNVNTPGVAICGVRIQSPVPLNPIECVPVLTGVVTEIIEFEVHIPPCVGMVLVKLS
jgi:hypothetical protein